MRNILLLTAIFIVAGCSRFDEDLCGSGCGKPAGIAEIRFLLPDMVMTATRSVDENAIGDIHLFLFGPDTYYRLVGSSGVQARVEIAEPGVYTAIAITNCDGIHSGMSLSELDALTFSGVVTDGRIVMSGHAEIEVSKGGTTVIEIELERALSKVSFNIEVDAKFNFSIFSVRLCSVPDRGFVVGRDGAMPQAEYVDYDEVSFDFLKSVEYGGVYLPENLKGRNNSIYDAKMRGMDNAPANSTYLHIRGMRSDYDYVYDYYILLGENITSDFNVRRNRHYRFDILLNVYPYGADTRVFYYRVGFLEKNQWGYEVGSKHSADQEIIGSFSYLGNSARYDLKTEIVFDMENWSEVEFDGQYLTSPKFEISPERSYTIRYYQEHFISGVNDRLTYSLVTTDQFGYSTYKVRNYTCHNKVVVEHSYADDPYKGWVSGSNQAYWGYGPTYPDRRCSSFIMSELAYITIGIFGVDDGSRFSAWYENWPGGRVITTESSFRVIPAQSITKFYPAFTSATPDSVKVFTDLRSVSVRCWDNSNGDVVVEHVVHPSLDFFTVPIGTTCQLRYWVSAYWYPTRYSKSSWLARSETVTITPIRDVMYWPDRN